MLDQPHQQLGYNNTSPIPISDLQFDSSNAEIFTLDYTRVVASILRLPPVSWWLLPAVVGSLMVQKLCSRVLMGGVWIHDGLNVLDKGIWDGGGSSSGEDVYVGGVAGGGGWW
ncbi:hypothetical protein HanIR_Chr09g0429381 [Helianthus annuus]|nr:hypothetical protein HanIR_Chr09g0429381 [Helianthus annuus]